MIYLDFTFDEDSIAEFCSENIPQTSGAVFRHTAVLTPVRFAVNDVEIFRSRQSSKKGLPPPFFQGEDLQEKMLLLPLYGFAEGLQFCCHELQHKKTSLYMLPGYSGNVYSTINGEMVKIYCSVTDAEAFVSHEELKSQCNQFAHKARTKLLEHLPELVKNEEVGWWFRDGSCPKQ